MRTGGQESQQLIIFGFLTIINFNFSYSDHHHTHNGLVRVNFANDIFQSFLFLSLSHVTVDVSHQ